MKSNINVKGLQFGQAPMTGPKPITKLYVVPQPGGQYKLRLVVPDQTGMSVEFNQQACYRQYYHAVAAARSLAKTLDLTHVYLPQYGEQYEAESVL